jgi:hypothetical protein
MFINNALTFLIFLKKCAVKLIGIKVCPKEVESPVISNDEFVSIFLKILFFRAKNYLGFESFLMFHYQIQKNLSIFLMLIGGAQ